MPETENIITQKRHKELQILYDAIKDYLPLDFDKFCGYSGNYAPLDFSKFCQYSEDRFSYLKTPFLVTNHLKKEHLEFMDKYLPNVVDFLTDNAHILVWCRICTPLELLKLSPQAVKGYIDDFFIQNYNNIFHLVIACIIEKMLFNHNVSLDIDKLVKYRFNNCKDFIPKIGINTVDCYCCIRTLDDAHAYEYFDPECLFSDVMFQYHQWVISSFLGAENV